jgi:hypothetical protein
VYPKNIIEYHAARTAYTGRARLVLNRLTKGHSIHNPPPPPPPAPAVPDLGDQITDLRLRLEETRVTVREVEREVARRNRLRDRAMAHLDQDIDSDGSFIGSDNEGNP